MNPLNGQTVNLMPQLAGVVITHLPNTYGYHAGRFEVIRLCFQSMVQNAGTFLPLAVWDNGSCQEFREWLFYSLKPQYLWFSPNVGKASARTAVIRSFPMDTVICVSDDDILYYPGWLKAQLELLRGFPNVGAVSGYPVRTQFRWGMKSNMAWAKEAGRACKVTQGKLIPDEWDLDFCTSVGRDYAWHKKYTAKDQDTRFDYSGLSAYATAHHCQFISEVGRIEHIVQWNDQALSDERIFDQAIDDAGLLRLTTTERYTRHMGNIMEPEFKAAIQAASRPTKPIQTEAIR